MNLLLGQVKNVVFFLNCFYVQDKVNEAVFATLHVDVARLTWPCEWVCIVQLV